MGNVMLLPVNLNFANVIQHFFRTCAFFGQSWILQDANVS